MTRGELASTTCASPAESRELVRRLAATRLFAKYERSFSAASGLPLALRPIESFQMPARGNKKENPFCALMANSRKGCAACLYAQSDLEEQASARTQTLRCYANLYDSMVPIRTGRKIIGFLQTGQVALAPLTSSDFDSVHQELVANGIDIDPNVAREAYLRSRCLSVDEYNGFVRMLEIFADMLGAAANALVLENHPRKDGGIVPKSLVYLEKSYQRKLTLGEVARASGASERHFCKVFKSETGLTFVNYLNRHRVEKAKQRLRESNRHVSEIAFEVGFESIAQFNRCFKRFAGEPPSAYRLQATR